MPNRQSFPEGCRPTVGTILKTAWHHAAWDLKVPWWGGADDLTPESMLDQFWNSSNVINVGMRKKKVVDLAWLDRPILDFSQGIPALSQTAIHHDGQAIGFHQVAGTGYVGFGT